MQINPINHLDGYKVDHRRQYPDGTNLIYSNFTARKSRIPEIDKIVFFGLQYFIKEYLIRDWQENFFSQPKDKVVAQYKRRIENYLGKDCITYEHIEYLHDLGYLPIVIKAVKEGTKVPVNIPCLTVYNTDPQCFWITNYLETILSCVLWTPITSATIANRYKTVFDKYSLETVGNTDFTPFQGHDFSFRGLSSLESACVSGAAHLLSFVGTDTIPAIDFLEDYYNADSDKELVGCSVPACYDDITEVLTDTGFKLFKDIDIDKDLIAEYQENGKINFVKASKYYSCDYNGPMVQFQKEGYKYIDLLVTPNHKMVKRTKTGKIIKFEADSQTYHDNGGYGNKNYMIVAGKAGYWNGEVFSALDQLKIAFQADGSFPNRDSAYTGERTGTYPIRFSLKKKRKMDRLVEIVTKLGYEYTLEKYENGYYSFWIKCTEKLQKDFAWIDLSKISEEWAIGFVHELQFWDGHISSKNTISYSSSNESCAKTAQAIGCLANFKTHFTTYIDKRGDRQPNHNVIFSLNRNYISGAKTQKTKIDYCGKVYCVTVPSGMLVVRRNNIVAICGNTEHSVMCMGGSDNEIETFRNLICNVYPKGIVSIVSDTWDFWQVVTEFLPKLKNEIMARDGKVVIRPDSGDPVKICCGDPDAETEWERKGAIECLWDTFGGTRNQVPDEDNQPLFKWYKQLDSHIGLIYGDSITLERQEQILSKLKQKGFASTNMVFGIGSYTYQYQTRDTFGFAMKATYSEVNEVGRNIFKDPKTDYDKVKKSHKGLMRLNSDMTLEQEVTLEEEAEGILEPVFIDGKLVREQSLRDIRELLVSQ